MLEDNNGVCLTQRKYCLELLAEFGMLACKPSKIPIESVNVSEKNKQKDCFKDEPLLGLNNYQKLVGNFIYLTLTRPYLSYAVHCLSQVMHRPKQSHLKLVFRVLRYPKEAPGKGISFKRSDTCNMKVFVDSD